MDFEDTLSALQGFIGKGWVESLERSKRADLLGMAGRHDPRAIHRPCRGCEQERGPLPRPS
jgi:hypothetical protein